MPGLDSSLCKTFSWVLPTATWADDAAAIGALTEAEGLVSRGGQRSLSSWRAPVVTGIRREQGAGPGAPTMTRSGWIRGQGRCERLLPALSVHAGEAVRADVAAGIYRSSGGLSR